MKACPAAEKNEFGSTRATMKPKILLCLALVLSGGLLSCSTATRYRCDVQSPKVAAVSKVKLKVIKVDSEETNSQNGYRENAVDGNPNTYWHTQWHGNSPGLPHEIIIELLPPSVIKGFTYLPRQDESDHGTIKDYEFYVSDDGKNFGQPVKKGAFEPGKEEKIETFEPVKCRYIKLKAISEINGLPWTSAAEIRFIQSGEDASVKDHWRGNTGQTDWESTALHDSAQPDAIDLFVANLSADGWLWVKGTDAIRVTQAATPEEVVSETLRMAKFKAGLMTSYRILNIRKVHIPNTYTAVLADTNLGRMIVLMQYIKGKHSTPGHWWRRIYDANPPIKRLY
jgi:hypothetical protein